MAARDCKLDQFRPPPIISLVILFKFWKPKDQFQLEGHAAVFTLKHSLILITAIASLVFSYATLGLF